MDKKRQGISTIQAMEQTEGGLMDHPFQVS
jgi:hypothetical protein